MYLDSIKGILSVEPTEFASVFAVVGGDSVLALLLSLIGDALM
jgi:hypothetical protein